MIVICGEGVVDLVPDVTGSYRFHARPGGGPVNTAVAAARLGGAVSMLARLSSDGFGAQLRRHLVANGVDTSYLVAAAEPSSIAVTSLDAAGSASYRFLVAGACDWQWTDRELARMPQGASAVHSGSLALAIEPGGSSVEALLVRSRPMCTVSIDPNIRPSLIADLPAHRARVERCVRAADLVKVSEEDLASLYPGQRPIDVARAWSRRGPGLVVMTAGELGATAVQRDLEVSCPAESVTVVDTIGAGDAFSGALLDWLARAGRLGGRLGEFDRDGLADLLQFAGRVSALTCTRAGADPPIRGGLGATANIPGVDGW